MRSVLLLALLALLLVSGPTRLAADSTLATAVIHADQPGVIISPKFMGYSHEWSTAQQLMGSAATGINALYRQLLQNLLVESGSRGPFIVRIGGNSTDSTTQPKPDVVQPFAELYAAQNVQFILGVNLGGGDVSLAVDQARAYLQGMPSGSLIAIEIGNEPDLYHDNGHRQPAYAYADFAHDFAVWRSAIAPLLPSGVGLVGPSWSSASSLKDLPAFLDQESKSAALSLVSHHWYAGTQCNGRTNPSDYLLRDDSATSGAKAVATSVDVSHQRGLPFRMGEMNSISCGGEAGVSDIFASALWITDSLFEFAHDGVDGVNLHTGNGGGYALFSFDISRDDVGTRYALSSIRPEYYGVLLFERAAPAGSRMLPVDLGSSANVKVWATQDSGGIIRVVAINKDEAASGIIAVHLAGMANGSLVRLQAPALEAKNGITFGGQTFDGAIDATLQGEVAVETVSPEDDTYRFDLSAVSAALLTIAPAAS